MAEIEQQQPVMSDHYSFEFMDESPDTAEINPPPMSSTKQTRINIWRTEVAALTLPPPPSPSSKVSSSSSAASHNGGATTSALSIITTSTSSGVSAGASSADSTLSRGRRLLSKLFGRTKKAKQEVTRTDMYRGMMPGVPLGDEDIALDDVDENDGGLMEKQERLARAARLLQQGV